MRDVDATLEPSSLVLVVIVLYDALPSPITHTSPHQPLVENHLSEMRIGSQIPQLGVKLSNWTI